MEKFTKIFDSLKDKLVICRDMLGIFIGVVDGGDDYYYVIKRLEDVALVSCVENVYLFVADSFDNLNTIKSVHYETTIEEFSIIKEKLIKEIEEENYNFIAK